MGRYKKTMNIGPLLAGLRQLGQRIPTKMQKAAEQHGRVAVEHLRKSRFEKYPGFESQDPGRNHLYSRTGALRRSIRSRKVGGNGGVVVEAGRGVGDRRATDNEYGRIISAPPQIPVPLAANTTRTGRRKHETVEAALAAGAHFWESPEGQLMVRLQTRGDRSANPFDYLFVMKDRVRIPPRFKFRETFRHSKHLLEDRKRRFRAAIRDAIQSGFGSR